LPMPAYVFPYACDLIPPEWRHPRATGWIILQHSCNPPQKPQQTLSFGPYKLTLTGWAFVGTA
jgi:hypothetical protein